MAWVKERVELIRSGLGKGAPEREELRLKKEWLRSHNL